MVSDKHALLIDYLNQVGFQRARFAIAGSILVILGLGLMFVPLKTISLISLIESYLLFIIGGGMIVLALLRIKSRRVFIIGSMTAAAGFILTPVAHLWPNQWVWVFSVIIFIIGIFKIVMVVKDWTNRKKYFFVSGVVDIVAAFLAIFFNNVEFLRILLGFTFFVMGVELLRISVSPASIPEHVKEMRTKYNKEHFSFKFAKRIPGEAYGAYLGGGFHAGIYVGNNMVVHFMDVEKVFHVSWEEFSLGRPVTLLKYPDLPEIKNEDVVKYALEQVNKKYSYHGITYNCENFVIQCLSLGETHSSMFAQTSAALSVMDTSPHLGVVVEFFSRILERPLFTKGGPLGRKFALWLRGVRSLVSRSILYKQYLSK